MVRKVGGQGGGEQNVSGSSEQLPMRNLSMRTGRIAEQVIPKAQPRTNRTFKHGVEKNPKYGETVLNKLPKAPK